MKSTLQLLLITISLSFLGCASLERAPLTNVPTPDSNPYLHDLSAQEKYHEGFQQGYADYVKGESKVSTSFRYRSPEARLHGYSDGKLQAMRYVKNTQPKKDLIHREKRHHEKPSWFDKYGETIEGIRHLEWPGVEVKWFGFK